MRCLLALVLAAAAAGCNSGITCDDGDPVNARCPGQPNSDGSEDVYPLCLPYEDCTGGSPRVECTEGGPSCDGRMRCVHKDDAEAVWESEAERCSD